MRQTQHSQHAPQTRHETYSLRGLLVVSALFPLAVLALAAPELVVAGGLGALTAAGLRRAWPVLRAARNRDSTPVRATGR